MPFSETALAGDIVLSREILLFVIGAAAIFFASGSLSVVGRDLALRLGIRATALGLFGLAIVTSMPELTVTFMSMVGTGAPASVAGASGSVSGAPDLALGNILGSNNFNVTMIVFLQAAFAGGWLLGKVDAKRFSRTAWLLLALTAIVGLGVIVGRRLPPGGALLLLSLPIVGLFIYEIVAERGEALDEEVEGVATAPTSRLAPQFLALAAAVIVGGLLVAKSGRAIAAYPFDVGGSPVTLGQTFVGTLFVAVATSLPEVTVALGAIRRAGSADIALGTLLGSNSINILIFAIGTPLYALRWAERSAWGDVSRGNFVSVVAAVVLTGIVLLGMSPRWARGRAWQRRLLTGVMVPVYLVALFLVYRGVF